MPYGRMEPGARRGTEPTTAEIIREILEHPGEPTEYYVGLLSSRYPQSSIRRKISRDIGHGLLYRTTVSRVTVTKEGKDWLVQRRYSEENYEKPKNYRSPFKE